jgi:CubicO group peptidase (beta-lactamase class C family)
MRAICLLFLLSLLSCTSDPGVTISGDLQPGVAQEGTLQQKEAKSYRLKLDSNSFIFGYVDQLSVDVVVELKDAGGNLLQSFDQPSKGPEHFSFVIDKTGDYTLEVAPFEEEAGDYTILIKKVEPLARDPEKRVDQLMVFFSGDNPGASIGVVKDGKLTFAKAYGKANLTHDLGFELDMPTNIGSVSKQFTAMSVLLLEKEGKLSLDDDVRKHIPELPDLGEVVTLRNILNHTNGWREVYNLMPIRGWYGEDKLLKSEVLNVLQHQTELQAAPGEEYNYNNSAFIMAAEIVERLSGQDFPAFVKENIFEPLGMFNSYVRSNPAEIIPRATQGYSNGETGYIESGDLDAAYGAGAIYTTPADLTKWLNNFESGQVGGKEVVEKLVTPGILNNGDTMTYALGIGIGEYKGLQRYAHTGADIAHRACLYYFPEIRGGVITLSNNATFPISLANQIADMFFSEHLAQPESTDEKDDTQTVTVAPDILEKYTGRYLAEGVGLVIEYMLEDGSLVAHPTGQSPLPLEPISDTTFQYSGIDASVVFHSDADGNYTNATHTQGGSDLVLIKMPPFDPSPEALAEYSGRYFSEELETFYTLTVKDSVLTAMHRNLEDIELTPVKPDHFNGSIYFIGELAFERNASGAVAAFTVSNGRTKGVLFERQ